MFSIKKVINLGIVCCMVVLLAGCGSKFPLPDKPIEKIILFEIHGEEEIKMVIEDREIIEAFLQEIKKAKKEYVGHIDFGSKITIQIFYENDLIFAHYLKDNRPGKSGWVIGDTLYEMDRLLP